MNLNLFPIGNCAASALIDERGRFVWSCAPRVDGEPVFSALLRPTCGDAGYWSIELASDMEVEAGYLRNTAILRTLMRDGSSEIEVIDFAPRARLNGRTYRPFGFFRLVRPLSGAPRITVRVRPTGDYGARRAEVAVGSNHARYHCGGMALRLTTNAPISFITAERTFRLERPLAFYFGADEPFPRDVLADGEDMLRETAADWREWVRTLALPLEWQEAVIRAAIALRLCVHEETGAIVAALTTSIPEAPDTQRNWDYRFCWIRDAYYVVRALNRLGAADILENYLGFLRNLVDAARNGAVQPVYGVGLEVDLQEEAAPHLSGYRGMGPVRIGNAAHLQAQHDVYGQIVMPLAQSFFDHRLLHMGDLSDFRALEEVGERAFAAFDQPDAGLWEFRTIARVHTYSALSCWAACDRLANVAAALGEGARVDFWRERAEAIRKRIESAAWNEDLGVFAASFGGSETDASLLQLAELGFLPHDDERIVATLARVESELLRGEHLMRYQSDDFGAPETGFNFCTFWLVEALHHAGRIDEARAIFERVLQRRSAAGLLSEDVDVHTGELWGNYPQTYSLVGIITCAMTLSRPWSAVR